MAYLIRPKGLSINYVKPLGVGEYYCYKVLQRIGVCLDLCYITLTKPVQVCNKLFKKFNVHL